MNRLFYLSAFFALSIMPLLADGLLMPTDENYPKELLRTRLTHVTVKINGLVAETEVYQEFENEWDRAVDAVYSFPLPQNARATQFLYWADDKVYKAVLKVQEQATNPGTGEGGVAAKVNKYIGRNGIKVALKGVPSRSVQKVKLYYVVHCDFYAGETAYRFPLDAGEFVTFPLDHLQFSIFVDSNSPITQFDCPSHPDYAVLENESHHLHLEMVKSKAYVAKDFEFIFHTERDQLGVDFYSVANDSMDGHFVLHVRPRNQAVTDDLLHRRVIYVISTSSNMFGAKLNQAIKAVKSSLQQLSETDAFNIVLYNWVVTTWQSMPIAANAANVQAAGAFLDGVSSDWGSRMDEALVRALAQVTDDLFLNSIIVLSDGRSPIDPRHIENINNFHAGIFPIGIGDDIDYARLEMLAALNYGFTTYLDDEDNITDGIERLWQKISRPIMKDVRIEFGRADLHDILPSKYPAAYAGATFFLTGRYAQPATSALSVGGQSVNGYTGFNFNLDFTSTTDAYKFAEHIWAKEKIDELEREIEIYGESPQAREQLIALSLQYNIRCRYTAYIADYETEYSHVKSDGGDGTMVPSSYLIGNYPNPFNACTTINFYIAPSEVDLVKLIKIYNMLGQLVAIIDISHYDAGAHSIRFDGLDYFGQPLPSGQYFVSLQVGEQRSTICVTLLK